MGILINLGGICVSSQSQKSSGIIQVIYMTCTLGVVMTMYVDGYHDITLYSTTTYKRISINVLYTTQAGNQ